MHVLLLDAIQVTIEDDGRVIRDLVMRTEVKGEKEWHKRKEEYLNRFFTDITPIPEYEKPNYLKEVYRLRHQRDGLYYTIGFNMTSAEIKD